MINTKNIFLPIVIIISAILFAGSLTMVASAQTTTDTSVKTNTNNGVVFPVAELGNCTDKTSCRAYCDDPSHMDACIYFGKSHGLINKDEADRGTRLATKLKTDAGPGGCKTPNECKAYCEDVTHLDVCLSFAKEHDLKDKNNNDSEKLASYIKSGGAMPGNCTSKETCDKYCSDFTHADECRTFAEKVGLNTGEGKKPVPPGQFQKFTELVKNGKTPGGCTSTESCKAYCSDTSHRNECISFGKDAGIIATDKADKLQKIGVAGPGGCNSEESCRAYCNDSTHRDECFKFAQDNKLISNDDLQKAQDGLVRFKQGLDNASPDVVACLKSSLGEDIINNIQTGNLTPGADIGDKAKNCFEKFGKKLDVKEELNKIPPQTLNCVKEKLGDTLSDIQSGKEELSADNADVIRTCAERMRFMGSSTPPRPMMRPEGEENNQSTTINQDNMRTVRALPATQNTLRYSGDVIACLKSSVNPDDIVRLENGQRADIDPSILAKCITSVRTNTTNTGIVPPSRVINSVPPQNNGINIRPEVLSCLKQNLEPEEFQKVLSGVKPEGNSEIILKCINSVQGIAPRPVGSQIPVQAVPIRATTESVPVKPAF